MDQHVVPPSTRTLELSQVAEINAAVGAGLAAPTPADLGVTHAPPHLLAATLRHLHMEGSPVFPYLFGVFGTEGGVLPLHTEHLRALSHALRLHHHWGV